MFIYTNPNPTNKKTGDCVIRAIAIATGSTWEDAYMDLCIRKSDSYVTGLRKPCITVR